MEKNKHCTNSQKKIISKQLFKNYTPVFLLPICSNIFYDLFEDFTEKDPLSLHQSGFILGGLYVQQLISVTHETYKAFDASIEMRGMFLNISKNFKVWHDKLSYTIKINDINRDLLKLMESFLSGRKIKKASVSSSSK